MSGFEPGWMLASELHSTLEAVECNKINECITIDIGVTFIPLSSESK